MGLEYQMYGKPAAKTFSYAKEILQEQADARNIDITNYYMIGDNPKGDIFGANSAGIRSILVKSGIYQGDRFKLRDEEMPWMEVDNMYEAVSKILEAEIIF